MLSDLISLKLKQIEAFKSQEWDKVNDFEQEFYKIATQIQLNSKDITQAQINDLHQINQLHNQIIKEASDLRDSSLNDLLEIRKGKEAIKAYSDQTQNLNLFG